MARLTIDGLGTVTVSDSFRDMPPDEQDAFVNHIREQASKGVRSGVFIDGVGTQPDKYQQAAQEKLASMKEKGLSENPYKQRLLSGMTLGASDEILAGLETPLQMYQHGTFNPAEGYRYAKALQDEQLNQARKNTGLMGDVTELAGGVLTGGRSLGGLLRPGQSLLGRAGAMAGEGAAYGGITGFNEGDGLTDRLKGAAGGAAIGGLLGGSLPVVSAVARNVASPVTSNVMSWLNPEAAARARVGRAIGESSVPISRVGQELSDAAAAGQGEFTLADALGNPGQRLLSTATRAPGPGRTFGVEFLNSRQAGQGDRVGGILDEALGADRTGRQFQAAKLAEARINAGPLYKQAFEGGSVAPLERQFQNAFSDAAASTSQAEKSLAAARQSQLLAKAKLSNAGENVYGVNSALGSGSEADAAVSQAEKALAAAKKNEASILERLRQAQADGSANAPGAVWSPRIQQFLDDPITKAGLSKGVKIQRLEALAKGEKFDPTELAIVGADEAGEPIVGKVPNMRTLDAVKRGLDDILESYRDKTTGKVHLDEYGRAVDQVRKSFLDHLDSINQNYKLARAAYAGPASEREAVDFGRSAASRGRAADTLDVFNNLKDIQRGPFRIGYADKLNEGIERGSQGVDASRRFTAGKYRQELPAISLPGAADELSRRLGRERTMFETRRQAIGGSQTAENLADQAENQIDPRIFSQLAHGNLWGAAASVARGAGNKLGGNTPTVRKHLAEMLLNNDPQAVTGLLGKLEADALNKAARQKKTTHLTRGLLAGEGEYVGSRVNR